MFVFEEKAIATRPTHALIYPLLYRTHRQEALQARWTALACPYFIIKE
jgi:hypothetical protein